jgi:hypothetical protein
MDLYEQDKFYAIVKVLDDSVIASCSSVNNPRVRGIDVTSVVDLSTD